MIDWGMNGKDINIHARSDAKYGPPGPGNTHRRPGLLAIPSLIQHHVVFIAAGKLYFGGLVFVMGKYQDGIIQRHLYIIHAILLRTGDNIRALDGHRYTFEWPGPVA